MTLRIPSVWQKHPELEADGYGTYRRTINLVNPYETIYLLVPELPSAWEIWVNGVFVERNGTIGKDRESTSPGRGTKIVALQADAEGLIDIWLQTSSYNHREGGTWNAPRLIPKAEIVVEVFKLIVWDGFLIGAMIMMGFYHLSLYYLRPGRKISPLLWSVLFGSRSPKI